MRIARIGGALLLIVVLFGATLNNEALYALFAGFWQKLFASVGASGPSPSPLQRTGTIGQITNTARNVPGVVTYSVLYLGTCFLLLRLLLPTLAQRRLAGIAYVLAAGMFLVLLLIGKLGSADSLILSNHLIHFIVSPLPVIVLAPLLRWYLPNTSAL